MAISGYSITVSNLRYSRANTTFWQEQRDMESFVPKYQSGGNRFYVGYTAYFDDWHSDDAEASKAIRPDIYDWLVEHAPNAVIIVSDYDHDTWEDVAHMYEREEDEESDEEELITEEDFDEEESGSASVYVDFGGDDKHAILFRMLFS